MKGKQFKNFRDAGAPATTARAHNYQDADELSVSDIDASRTGHAPDFETLKQIADASFMPLTFFGGINSIDRASECMNVGADKLGLTTTAFANPKLIDQIAHQYGAQAVVLGLDVIKHGDGTYKLFDHRTGLAYPERNDPFIWVKEAVDRGCGEVRLMAVSQEGTLNGFDITLFSKVKSLVNIPLILEGGGGSLEHIEQAYKSGVTAIAVGSMLVFSDSNLVKIKQHMRTRNISLRA